MGLGDAPLPVASTAEANNPVPSAGLDAHNRVDDRLTVLERSGNTEIVRQLRFLFETLQAEKVAGNLTVGTYTYPPA